MNIHSIETFGTHEGPGIRFVIFVQGCNYKCLYCHNPDTQKIKLNDKNIHPLSLPLTKREKMEQEYSINELVEMIEKNRPYFGDKGGVTVSGGEPLLQAKEIAELFKRLKLRPHLASPSKGEELAQGIHTALDTNGSILNDDVKELLKYTDLVLLDIKHIDLKWHEKVTGVKIPTGVIARSRSDEAIYPDGLPRLDSSNQSMAPTSPSYEGHGRNDNNESPEQLNNDYCIPSIRFAEYLESQNIPFWIRYVLVPGYTDQDEYLEQTAHMVGCFENLERIEILPYHTMGEYKYEELNIEYKLKGIEPPTQEMVEKAKSIFEKSGKKVLIR